MNSYLTQTTAPTTSIATLAEFKAHARIEINYEDATIQHYLDAATAQVELESSSCFTAQVWQQNTDKLCAGIPLLKKGFSSIVVKYYDTNNTLQTINSSNYAVIQAGSPGLYFLNSYSRPPVFDRKDAVQIIMTFDGNHRLKPVAKQSCLLLAANWFKNRESETENNTRPIVHGYDRAMDLLRTRIRI